MKNLTLSVEEAVLDEVYLYAAKRNTTVDALIREFFGQIAAKNGPRELALERLLELADNSTGRIGRITWTRGDLYDR